MWPVDHSALFTFMLHTQKKKDKKNKTAYTEGKRFIMILQHFTSNKI